MPLTGAAKNRLQRAKSLLDSEIGSLPKVVDPERRWQCREDLGLFLKTYMPGHFYLPWAGDQVEAIETLQRNVFVGGVSATAAPRGTGKTTIIMGAVIWMALYDHRNFIVVVGPTGKHAAEFIRDLKAELETSPLLLEDFPEVCHPVQCLEGKYQRCASQTVDGVRTRMTWKADKLIFPSYDLAGELGTIIVGEGMTGSIRGKKHNDGGKTLRPDFVLLDDVQTRDSAKSTMQTDEREKIIQGDIMGLAGHDKAIAATMLCTVIYENDLSDRYLKRWNGYRSALVTTWPKETKLWEEYRELWESGQGSGGGIEEANKFYADHRETMDKGAVINYPGYDKDQELSAVQHAFNLRFGLGEEGFLAEYQNDPPSSTRVQYDLQADRIAANLNGFKRYEVPISARIITGFVDINYAGLHYAMAGFENNLTGYICDWGRYPGNGVLFDPQKPKGLTDEQTIYEGLGRLIPNITDKVYSRGGQDVHPDLVMIDCGAQWQDTVLGWIKLNGPKMGCRVVASRGRGVKQYRPSKPIGKPGDNFHLTDFGGKGRVLVHNADLWRMRQQRAWFLEPGAPGSLSLWGNESKTHRYISEHIAAERLVDYVSTDASEFYSWYVQAGMNNDLGDCAVGARVAACVMGCAASPGSATRRKQKKRRRGGVSYSPA